MEKRIAKNVVEALLFVNSQALSIAKIAKILPAGTRIEELLKELRNEYEGRGIRVVNLGGKWAMRSCVEVSPYLRSYRQKQKKLSRAAMEVLAICAYHQPVTRLKIEEIRGYSLSREIMENLLSRGWIKLAGRKKAPGRPLIWRTTEEFLDHFNLRSISDLPKEKELKALLSSAQDGQGR